MATLQTACCIDDRIQDLCVFLVAQPQCIKCLSTEVPELHGLAFLRMLSVYHTVIKTHRLCWCVLQHMCTSKPTSLLYLTRLLFPGSLHRPFSWRL
jgi:hypothetical protein